MSYTNTIKTRPARDGEGALAPRVGPRRWMWRPRNDRRLRSRRIVAKTFMGAKEILEDFAAQAGWDIEWLLELACRYIDRQDDERAFRDFVREQFEEEEGQEPEEYEEKDEDEEDFDDGG